MALPASREFDAVDGGPMSADVLNAIQDGIVAAHAGKIIAADAGVFAIDQRLVLPAAAGQVGSLGATSLGSSWGSDTGGERSVFFQIPLRMGDRIKRLEVFIREGNAAGETVAAGLLTQLFDDDSFVAARDSEGTPAVPKTSGTSGQANTLDWTIADDAFPLVLGSDPALGHDCGYVVLCVLQATSADDESRVYGCRVTWDRP